MSWKKEIKDIVSVKYRKEAEKSMKKTVKRIFSGVLSALTILTSVVQPMTAYAGETNPKSYEMEYPVQILLERYAYSEIVGTFILI